MTVEATPVTTKKNRLFYQAPQLTLHNSVRGTGGAATISTSGLHHDVLRAITPPAIWVDAPSYQHMPLAYLLVATLISVVAATVVVASAMVAIVIHPRAAHSSLLFHSDRPYRWGDLYRQLRLPPIDSDRHPHTSARTFSAGQAVSAVRPPPAIVVASSGKLRGTAIPSVALVWGAVGAPATSARAAATDTGRVRRLPERRYRGRQLSPVTALPLLCGQDGRPRCPRHLLEERRLRHTGMWLSAVRVAVSSPLLWQEMMAGAPAFMVPRLTTIAPASAESTGGGVVHASSAGRTANALVAAGTGNAVAIPASGDRVPSAESVEGAAGAPASLPERSAATSGDYPTALVVGGGWHAWIVSWNGSVGGNFDSGTSD